MFDVGLTVLASCYKWRLKTGVFLFLLQVQKVCLSYRCADMDREIPALMGVSKAVLENVIFVHQDEANWPLQDPSSLKKKFDDIFSATRYTKALEVIKKLHKEQAQEIKAYKLKLENLQTLKDSAYKVTNSAPLS
ncbi:DNA repair protein RAD50 [Linum grandiflorum]